MVVGLNEDAPRRNACYVFRQNVSPHGPLHPITKAEALIASKLWNEAPNSIEWLQWIEMAEIGFVTIDYCFPCAAWGSSGHCFHVDGVRQHLDLLPRRDPGERVLGGAKQRGLPAKTEAHLFKYDAVVRE